MPSPVQTLLEKPQGFLLVENETGPWLEISSCGTFASSAVAAQPLMWLATVVSFMSASEKEGMLKKKNEDITAKETRQDRTLPDSLALGDGYSLIIVGLFLRGSRGRNAGDPDQEHPPESS